MRQGHSASAVTAAAAGRKGAPSDPASAETVDFGPLAGLAGFMLRLAQIRVFESFFRDFGAQGITPGQISILVIIGRNPGLRQGVLAEALSIKRSNMAKIVRRLDAGGLIERQVPANDRRAVELRLTGRGRSLAEAITPELAVSDRRATGMLSEPERRALLGLLSRLAGRGPEGSA